ncbi:NAD(P)-binding protein [Erysiphe pulchra]|uniref:NAD(P)-binding protein n=1 Tax=Erysiphe pulchra TaxID=225359 RepID=A0A2S4PR21_9PEZI|nr:NAD(P)-binding protein [Erysiphe pulchra]
MTDSKMTTAPIRIVVCGGNGFLGSRICKFAVARGWDVTSLSRSGEPKWASVTSSATPPNWAHEVHWERADILKPTTYSPLLKKADYVVHSLGILLEADYKGIISGRESPITGLKEAFSAAGSGSQNPLTRRKDEDLQSQENDNRLTYELINRDSAITLAQEASNNGVPTFAYISAVGGAPILPQRYITTKREAESTISSEFCKMRSIFFRPGLLYNRSRTLTIPLAAMATAGTAFNSLTGGIFSGIMGAAGAKPLDADVVAEAVVEALSDENVKGPVEIKEIEELAQKAWRKGML